MIWHSKLLHERFDLGRSDVLQELLYVYHPATPQDSTRARNPTSTISQPPFYQDDARFLALGLGRRPKVFGFWRRTAPGLSNLDGSGPKPVNSQAKPG
jgi:predicted alpha-1,6-mannanase (GH76 family)